MTFTKTDHSFNDLYVNEFKNENAKTRALFIHGGPGNNCEKFEVLLQNHPAYQNTAVTWITYDQRGCGRSKKNVETVTHEHNLEDLKAVLEHLSKLGKKPDVIYGHSYGAWLLYDAALAYPNVITQKIVFGGRSLSRSLPKTRSLLMDLLLLKWKQPTDYQKALAHVEHNEDTYMQARNAVRALLKDQDERSTFYWGNLEAKAQMLEWQKQCKLPLENPDVFQDVAHTMYHGDKTYGPMDPKQLKQDHVFLLGYHDFLMGGELDVEENAPIKRFWKSGHYPHVEEVEEFLMMISV